jgi:RNA 2',3'-cyclic 3'-phosphodiesterase
VRLFLAVEPDAAARAALAGVLAQARAALGDAAPAVRWTLPPNIHVTLHFLGELDQARVANVRAALGDRLPRPAFDVETNRPGVFPPAGPPKVVWLGIGTGADALTAVHADLALRLERAGVALERRRFTPHLTVGRVRDRERGRARALRERLAGIRPDPIRWRAREVVLFRSDLSGAAPRHDPVQVLRLDAGSDTAG